METYIDREFERFIENFSFNECLALNTEKPHLARWAYGACEEWIKDFESEISKTETGLIYNDVVEGMRKNNLERLKQTLRTKFSDNKILIRML